LDINRSLITKASYTDVEKLNIASNEDAFIFRPQWNDPLPKHYSTLQTNITYQKGAILEQYTLTYGDNKTNEKAIVNVRFAPLVLSEIIEFEVRLAPIPIDDHKGKDIIVAWKLYNDFNLNGTFWTDSNGLQMQERKIKNMTYKADDPSNIVDK
jgi:hypothetical protein